MSGVDEGLEGLTRSATDGFDATSEDEGIRASTSNSETAVPQLRRLSWVFEIICRHLNKYEAIKWDIVF